MNYTKRFLAGIFSVILLGLIIVGPLYLSEKLEDLETSQSGIVPTSEILTSSTSSYSYSPYLQLNSSTEGNVYISPPGWLYGVYGYWTTGRGTLTKNYDYDGTKDLITSTHENTIYVNIVMNIDWEQMVTDGINTIYYYMEMFNGETYKLNAMRFLDNNGGAYGEGDYQEFENYEDSPYDTNPVNVTFTLTETDITTVSSFFSSTPLAEQQMSIALQIDNFQLGNTMEIDWQLAPEYFEAVTGTVWDNQTVTTYEPHILAITPYAVHKVSMGLGGILIICFGWIASPFNKNFNNFIPVNAFSWRKRGRSK